MDRQPSTPITFSSEAFVISGLINTKSFLGLGGASSLSSSSSSPSAYSTTASCCEMLIWGAASPTPGASRIVSIMSSINVCRSLSNFVTGFALRLKMGSGKFTICLNAMLVKFLFFADACLDNGVWTSVRTLMGVSDRLSEIHVIHGLVIHQGVYLIIFFKIIHALTGQTGF